MLPGLQKVHSNDEMSFFLLLPTVCYHLWAPMVELTQEGQDVDVDQVKRLHGCVCIFNSQVPARVSVTLAVTSPGSVLLRRQYTHSSL